MSAGDPHRFSTQLDESTTQRLIDRLESRANDTVFNRLFEQYITKLNLPKSARVLEVGCGTGANIRTLLHRQHFSNKVIGVDQSPAFIEAAKCFANKEGLEESVEFNVGDAHDLNFDNESFDVVIAHTLISHVTNPEIILREIVRLVRRGGVIAIFDGDYASLTYAYPDREFGRQMDHALASTTFNNPLVMRDLIRLLPEIGVKVTDVLANVVSETGDGSFFKSFAKAYVPMVINAGLLPNEKVEDWFAFQNREMSEGNFFASCNYYTYLAKRT